MKTRLLQDTFMVSKSASSSTTPWRSMALPSIFALIAIVAMALNPNSLTAQVSYTQDFETGISGWSTNWSVSTINPCGGLNSVRKNIYTVSTGGDFVSPSLGTSNGGAVTLSFNYKITDYSAPYPATPATFGTINVQYSASASGPWTTAYTINSGNHVPSTSCATVSVPSFTAVNGPLYIRFNCIWGAGDYYLHFDDIIVSQGAPPACSTPSVLSAVPTSSGASLNWTENGNATAWDVEYGLTGFTPGAGTTMAATAKPFSISGLTANTSYSYYVRANCGGSGTSGWNGPFTFTTLCASQLNGTVTVNPALPASATNFQTLAALSNELNQCGISGPVTVNIAQGTYTTQLYLNAIIGLSTTNTLIIQAAPSNTQPVILAYNAVLVADNWVAQINNASNITIDGLEFAPSNASNARSLLIGGTSSNITITNNTFIGAATSTTSSSYAHIYYGGSPVVNNLTISNNTFNGGAMAMYLVSTSIAPSDNFVITNNTVTDVLGYGFYLSYVKKATISHNTIHFASGTSTQYGIYFSGGTTSFLERAIFEGNDIVLNTTSTVYGIYLTYVDASAAAPSSIVNNMIASASTGTTGTRYGIYPLTCEHLNIYHNTISILDGSATDSRALYINASTTVTYPVGFVKIKNNIISSSGATGYAIEISAAAITRGNVSEMSNNVYNFKSTNAAAMRYGATNYGTLAAWQGATFMDAGSIQGDPIFVSATNLHVLGIIANDGGDNSVGVLVDIDGQVRPAAGSTIVDIGADEFSPSTCFPPTLLNVTAITNTGATLGWTTGGASNWNVEYGVAGFTPGLGTKVSTTSSSLVVANLSPNTAYEFYVRDSCGATNKSLWAGPFAFSTACNPYSVPYFEGFESGYTNGIAVGGCVSQENVTGTSTWVANNVETLYQRSPRTGSWNANLRYGNERWMFVGINLVGGTSYTFSAYARQDGITTANASMRIAYGMSNDSASMINTIVAATGLDSSYQKITGAFTPATTGTYYIGMKGKINSSPWYISIDDISVTLSPNCLAPTSLGVTNLNATSVDAYWTTGSASNWKIQHGPAGFALGTGTISAVTNDTTTISSLTANTAYAFYVKDSCSASSVSTWSGPYNFSTPCVAYTIPYFEGFETGYTNSTAVLGCVSQEALTGSNPWTANNVDTTYNRKPRTGTWNAYLRYSNERWMFVPVNLVGGTSYTFQAYARQDGAVATNASLTVAYGSLNSSAGMTNTIIPATGLVNGNYQQLIGNFIPATSGTYFIGIKGKINGSPWYISIDDISLVVSPNCPAPTNLGARNITSTSADVFWSATGASNWKVQYGATGFALGAGTIVNATNDTTTLNGLTAQTAYQFYVKDSCSVTNVSTWAGPFAFTTGCAVFPLTFTETVETTSPSLACWGTNGQWAAATSGGYGASSRSFVFPCYNISSGSFILESPQTAPTAAGATLSFDHAYATYSTEIDSLRVLTSTDGGLTYTVLTNLAGGVNGPLTTAPPSSSSFVPTATQWATFNMALPVGTNRVRFVGISDYGNNIYVDNIVIGTATVAALAPFTLIAPANNAVINIAGSGQNMLSASWHRSGTGATYQWRAFMPNGTVNMPLVSLSSDNNGMDTILTMTYAQVDALLASLAINVGDTATLKWSVRAKLGTDSLFATTPFTLKLVRGTLSNPVLTSAPPFSNANTAAGGPNGTAAYKYFRTAIHIPASEMTQADIDNNDNLRSWGMRLNAPSTGAVTFAVKLYVKNTADATYLKSNIWDTIIKDMSQIIIDTITVPSGANGFDIPINMNFAYTGANMYVAVDFVQISPAIGQLTYRANNVIANSARRQASATVPPVTLAGVSGFRPEMVWGTDRLANDLEVMAIWAKGKNPLIYGTPEQVSVVVRNNGYQTATKLVTLNVTGANTLSNTVSVTLTSTQVDTVTFNFAATAAGFNTMVASVPTDDLASNNSLTWVQQTTTDTYGYADTSTVGLSSVGYNTGSGLLLSKFKINGTRTVTEVRMRIGDGVANVGNTIYAVVVNSSNSIVAQSANYVITAGDLATWKTFTITTPPSFTNEEFYVGMAQTANAVTGYFPLAYKAEEPTRPNAYYTSALVPTTIDPVSGFRLLIEAIIAAPASCPSPTAVVAVAGCTDAVVTWTSGTGSVGSTIQYGPAGFTPGTGTIVANVTSPYTITGLTLNTAYDVWVKDSCGTSVSTYAGPINFTTLNKPTAAFTYTANGFGLSVDGSTSTGSGPLTYNWSFGDATLGTGVTTSHTYTSGGSFTITLIVSNACGSDTATQVVANIGIEDYALNTAQLFPNPNTGLFQIVGLPLDGGIVQIEISNVTGAVVYRTNADDDKVQIDLTGYAPGVYQVRMINEKGVSVKPFVLRN